MFTTPIWTVPILDHKPIEINEYAFKKPYKLEDVSMYVYTNKLNVDMLFVEIPKLDKQEYNAFEIFNKSGCFQYKTSEEKGVCIFEYLINNGLFCFPTEEYQL